MEIQLEIRVHWICYVTVYNNFLQFFQKIFNRISFFSQGISPQSNPISTITVQELITNAMKLIGVLISTFKTVTQVFKNSSTTQEHKNKNFNYMINRSHDCGVITSRNVC